MNKDLLMERLRLRRLDGTPAAQDMLAAADRIDALTAELDKEQKWRKLTQAGAPFLELKLQGEKLDKLAEALRKYGCHLDVCGWQKPCKCGLEDVLRSCGCTIGSDNG